MRQLGGIFSLLTSGRQAMTAHSVVQVDAHKSVAVLRDASLVVVKS